MKSRLFAFFTAAVFLLNVAGSVAADTHGRKAKKRQSNPLVALLPASDGVATLESRRFFGDAMSQILSSNQPMLASIMAQLDDVEAKTGIDLRKFDSVAIGLALRKINDKNYDFDPVAIARGDLKEGALVEIVKLASSGTYSEEKFGDHTIYIFSAKDVIQKTTAKTKGWSIESMISKALNGLTHEIAVTELDANTLAFGSLPRVIETLDSKTHISPDVSGLLGQKESAVLDFALRTPAGMSKLLPLDNDELGQNIDSIRYLSGSIDIAAAGTTLQVIARTLKAEQAQGLYQTLDGLKTVGKAFLGGSKRADQRVYAKLIENAKISVHGTFVTLDLLVPQSDIDTLIGVAAK